MTLKNISILFIVLFFVNIVIMASEGGDGSWGIPFSFVTLMALIAAYAFFWFGGNMECWTNYNKPDKKLVVWLINLPALVMVVLIIIAAIA